MRRSVEAGHHTWARGTEWDEVRALLAGEAQTALGRERAEAAEPSGDAEVVRAAIETTRQARLALATAGPPPVPPGADIRRVLDRCRLPGSTLDGPELVQLLPVLEACPRLQAWGRSVTEVGPAVAALTEGLPRFPELAGRLGRALDGDGAVTDEASPTLRRLRREIRERRRRLVGELERAFQATDADRLFADRYVTVRHGRYVLPVRAEARGRLRGIVHDRSQSGQTVFVEPDFAIDANNELVQAVRAEEHETARVLGELTDAVRERLGDLDIVVGAIGELDWVCARALAAERMGATPPLIGPDRTLRVENARHPLLLAQSWRDPSRPVVPVTLELTADHPLLVITGPNAGGKTIALKTAALLAMMAQTGCHIPADEGARLAVFSDVHAIIGDDQSVAENLSTFSAFVRRVREILAVAGPRSLVLLDELGAGTDPDEGAALAQAILEALAERGALVIATTHLEPLKAFASTHPRAENASVEFDEATLAPTFRLRYGHPGRSYALAIAGRLGLPADLIARAEAYRSQDATRMAELVARLDEHARREAERAIAAERSQSETAARLAAAREAEAAAERKARAIVEHARAEATALLTDLRRALAAEWDRLKRAERSRRSLEESRRRVREVAARVDTLTPPETAGTDAEAPAALVPGATVAAEHLGVRGELVAVAGSTATVRSGTITVRVPVQALRPVAGHAEERKTVARRPPRPDLPAREMPDELLLLGRTTDEARDAVEKYLDDAFLAGLASVRLVHGKGSGALRRTVRDLLSSHPLVESFRDGEPAEGGAGATVAALRVG